MYMKKKYFPNFKRLGVWENITKIKNILINHTECLAYSYKNNVVESYNFMLAKFVSGKLINFSKKRIF